MQVVRLATQDVEFISQASKFPRGTKPWSPTPSAKSAERMGHPFAVDGIQLQVQEGAACHVLFSGASRGSRHFSKSARSGAPGNPTARRTKGDCLCNRLWVLKKSLRLAGEIE